MNYGFQEYKPFEVKRDHLNLGGANPAGERIEVTSAYFLRGGKPWIGVMGEFHFSRYSREYWYEELCKMKAGGITIVSTYLFWIYHEEIENEYHFSGDNDVRAFILECQRAGLDVVIRVGPWCHGECRNGGFPDWLLKKPYPLRENHPEYLEQVRRWYQKIQEQVQGLYYHEGGNIIAVQLENEFCTSAEHLAVLKQIAVSCGMMVPLYFVTGWNSANGAKIPVREVVPLFGGYCDAPWDSGREALPPSIHYFFLQQRNDTAIGSDLSTAAAADGEWQLPYEQYPFATCELGGGLQNTHHRRYIVKGLDIYAVALVKLGVGNNLTGYYMYHGGSNQLGRLSTFQESRATGYPNDCPIISYDFQAPVSEYGEVREQYRLLNLLHLFIQDFGEILAPMSAVNADVFVKREDTSSLRYGARSNGEGGFVFVNHYQRRTLLQDIKDVVIHTGTVCFPPIDVCGEISFFLPFRMDLSGVLLESATAQPICRMKDTYFFVQIPGIRAEYKIEDEMIRIEPGLEPAIIGAGFRIVTLTWNQAQYLRRLGGQLYIGDHCDLYEMDGEIHAVQTGDYSYYEWIGSRFEYKSVKQAYQEPSVRFEQLQEQPFEPKYKEELCIGGERKLTWQKMLVEGSQGFVSIDYVGDAAQIYADGELIADHYYYGAPWRIPAKLLSARECYLVFSEMKDDFYKEF